MMSMFLLLFQKTGSVISTGDAAGPGCVPKYAFMVLKIQIGKEEHHLLLLHYVLITVIAEH